MASYEISISKTKSEIFLTVVSRERGSAAGDDDDDDDGGSVVHSRISAHLTHSLSGAS